jgi:hypothetical protein
MQKAILQAMSEEKMIKHSETALKILKNKSVSFREKIIGFIEEVFIIILAVSITLMLHNWNDRRHEREIERNFLLGTSDDLKRGAHSLTESIKHFQPTIDYYHEVSRQMDRKKIDTQYVDKSSGYLQNTLYWSFDGSRFEGFKSSGYLRLIENQQLLQHLLRLYSVEMPFQRDADINVFHTREQDFNRYIGMKSDMDSTGNFHVARLLHDKEVSYQIYRYTSYFEERKRLKEDLINEMLAVAAEIDNELKKED